MRLCTILSSFKHCILSYSLKIDLRLQMISLFCLSLSFRVIVNAEAGMTVHSQRWGLIQVWPIARPHYASFFRASCRSYTTPTRSCVTQVLPAFPANVITVRCKRIVARRTWQWRPSVSTVDTHYSSGAPVPECNGLSQFREDTDKPSIPVWEFNLIACLLVQSRRKTPYWTGFEPGLARVFSW